MCFGVIRTWQHEKTINGVDILLLDLSVCLFFYNQYQCYVPKQSSITLKHKMLSTERYMENNNN